MAEHSLLSPSSAERWLNCPPSALLNRTYSTNSAAEEGTKAHELAELWLKKRFDKISKEEYERRMSNIKLDDAEMTDYVREYVAYVEEIYNSLASPSILIEHRLDLSDFAEGCFGTADVVIVTEHKLLIIDFKYGRITVDSEDNPQLKLYALGAYGEFNLYFDLEDIELIIYQPRANNITHFQTNLDKLLKWGQLVKQRAVLAKKGDGEREVGSWCKYCQAKNTCEKRTNTMLQLVENCPKSPGDNLSGILSRKKEIVDWLEGLEQYAVERILNGETVEGFKLVRGRGTNKFTDELTFYGLISHNYPIEEFQKTTPITPLQTKNKLLKTYKDKDTWSRIESECVEKTEGKLTLVPISDKRQAYTAGSEFLEEVF